MYYAIFYSIFLLIFLLVSVFKRTNALGLLLVIIYFAVSLFSIYLIKNDTLNELDVSEIRMWPYILMVFSYLLCFYPFLQKRRPLDTKKIISINDNGFFIFFLYLYTFLSFIRVIMEVPNIILIVKEGNWAETYTLGSNQVYSTIIGQYIMMFVSYFRLIAIVIAFCFLTDKNRTNKRNWLLPTLTMIFALGTGFFGAISSASRSLMFDVALTFFAVVIFFFKKFSKNQKILFSSIGIIGALVFVILMLRISDSRFSSRGTLIYLFSYLGQAPTCFNSQLATKINTFMFGEYAFGGLVGITSFDPSTIGGTWGTHFYTYVGYLYIDWGPFGTIVISLIICLILFATIKKEKYYVSDVFLIFVIYQFLLNGTFVIGRGYILSLIVNLIIFLFIKLFVENRSFSFQINKKIQIQK